jgi:uncharacterized protein (DUF1501 family)
MNRRGFLGTMGAVTASAWAPAAALAAHTGGSQSRLLVLIELRGGNDGLNTVVPFAAPEYYRLRPRLAVARDQVLQLDERIGLHPALRPVLPIWQDRELAIVQGVGCPHASRSHYRAIETWDTACAEAEPAHGGWLARALRQGAPPLLQQLAKAVATGGDARGPFAGCAPLPPAAAGDAEMLARIVSHAFDHAGCAAPQFSAGGNGAMAVRISLNGYDTHSGQRETHARLLRQLAVGVMTLRHALVAAGRWDSTLVMTYSEFGRSAGENSSAGTDHGAAAAHFVLGGRVRGGLHGRPPDLSGLGGNGCLACAVDFRQIYAVVLEKWWGMDAAAVLGGKQRLLDLLRA